MSLMHATKTEPAEVSESYPASESLLINLGQPTLSIEVGVRSLIVLQRTTFGKQSPPMLKEG